MRLLFIALLALLPVTIFAQSNYHQGYVLKNNGDTLKGYIDYREWSQSPTAVNFKTTMDDKEQIQFDPGNIKGFQITGMETYITYNGLISNDRNRLPDLPNYLDTSKIQANIFLRKLTSRGNLSLYSQTDGRKTRYFVAEGNSVPVELKYNQYYTENHDAIERAFFRGQLILYVDKYAAGDKRLMDQAGQVAFEDDQLVQIIDDINGNSLSTAMAAVVKNNGEILKGFIDYTNGDQTPTVVNFRVNKDDKETLQFRPENIKGFEISGFEKYITYTGLISNDSNSTPDLPNSLDTSKIQATVFLRQITTGPYLSLYSHTDGKKTRYFIAEGSAMPVELKYNQYYTEHHDVVEKSSYRGQLIFYIYKYAASDKRLVREAGETAFERDQLKQIIDEINGNLIDPNNVNKSSRLRFFMGAALMYTKTEYNNPGFSVSTETGMLYYAFQSHSISVLPQLNAGVDILNNPNVQQLFFRVNASLSFVSVDTSYPVTSTQNDNLSFDQFTFGITPQIIYNIYNRDNFKVYIDGGVALNFSTYGTMELSGQAVAPADSPNVHLPSFSLSHFWVGVPFQTGVVINKRWEASFCFTPYSKIVPTTSEKLSNESFGVGIKFFLGK